jgi:hypothetical protein
VINLRCREGKLCAYHADGGSAQAKCPGLCDAPGCLRDGEISVDDETDYCRPCAARALLKDLDISMTEGIRLLAEYERRLSSHARTRNGATAVEIRRWLQSCSLVFGPIG